MLRITPRRGRVSQATSSFALARVRIGSAPDNEIVCAERGVLPRHAEIHGNAGTYWLLDLGTPTGTFVNQRPVRRHRLESGDLVTVGGPTGVSFSVEIGRVEDDGGRVDLETAQRIVRDAVVRATARENKTQAIVDTKVRAATRRATLHNTVLAIGVLLAFGALLVAAVMIYKSRRAADVLVEQAGLKATPVTPPTGAIPTRVYTGREIYDANKAALYVIGYVNGNRIGGICTAFAIKPDLLATNAHCVVALREREGKPIVTQNDSGGKVRFDVIGATMHPAYDAKHKSADSPDVGLLRVRARMPTVVTFGSDAELRAIGPGDDVYVLGFPGRVLDPISPSTTFLRGHIGRCLGLDQEPTTPDKAVILQHDAVTRGGNSGSPIFNQYGHVIGVHAAHLDEEEEVEVGGKKTKVVVSSPFRIGMRIDLLQKVPAP